MSILVWLGALAWGLRRDISPPRSWESEVAQFEKRDLTNAPPEEAVLFVGSSSIKLWESLRADLPRYRVFRRGFGGAHMSDVVKYARRVILPYDLEMVVVHAGGNDIAAGATPDEVFEEYKELVKILHRHDPKLRVAFLSLKPSPSRWTIRKNLAEVNEKIAKFAATDARLVYIDIYSKMMGPGEVARPDLFAEDGLHLNSRGYRIWADAVRPHLPQTARKSMSEMPPSLATAP